MDFRLAKCAYPHRYTLEHVPQWAATPAPNGKYYAPQYRSDREWYAHTLFPSDNPYHKQDCHSTEQTWPLGQWLDQAYPKK